MNVNLVLSDEIGEQLGRIAAELGFSSRDAFVHAVIQREVERNSVEKAGGEQLTEALQQLWEQTKRLRNEKGTTPELIHSLSKLIFAFTAELELHAFTRALSTAVGRDGDSEETFY